MGILEPTSYTKLENSPSFIVSSIRNSIDGDEATSQFISNLVASMQCRFNAIDTLPSYDYRCQVDYAYVCNNILHELADLG